MRIPHLAQDRQLLSVVGLCIGLLGLIYGELASTPTAVVQVSPPAPKPEAETGAPPVFNPPPPSDYADALARPLFSSSRRPPSAEPAAVDAHPDFVLVGIVLSDRDAHALIQHGQPSHVDRVIEGQALDGWTVDAILPDRVVFRRADAQIEVKAKDRSPPAVRPRADGRSGDAATTGQRRPNHDNA